MSIGELALIGLIAGVVCGLLPLGVGLWKDRRGLGLAGLVSSAVAGAILGVILALPVAIVFTLAIVLMRPERARPSTA